jgi:hypothetical protein
MAALVGVYEDVGLGASSFPGLAPAAGGGCRYNIVSVSLLGNGSVCNRGIAIAAISKADRQATDPTAAQGFRGRSSTK